MAYVLKSVFFDNFEIMRTEYDFLFTKLERRRAQKGRVFFILQSKIGTDSFDGKAQSCGEEYKSSILSDEPHSMESTRRKTAARDSYTIDQSRHLLYFLPGVSLWCIF